MNISLPSVVFITGTFIANNCWNEWVAYFEQKGYTCLAPAWPHKDAPAEDLRNRLSNDPIALNTIITITDHFAAIISVLPVKPILIGHSLGGLVVQLLLQRNLAAAGVAIHSFPPQGINRFRLSFVKAVWETMMLFTPGSETYLVPFRKWRYAFVNGVDGDLQKELYYRYAIPESKKIIREIFKCSTSIEFKKVHVPILFTSGSNDKLVPASLNYSNYKKYAKNNPLASYKEFKGHNHLVFGLPAGKNEADFILYWLQGITYKK